MVGLSTATKAKVRNHVQRIVYARRKNTRIRINGKSKPPTTPIAIEETPSHRENDKK